MAPIRVLYVDDEADLLEMVKLFLERSGDILVDTASSVEEAEKSVIGDRYDAIISDYQMPGTDGLEFLKRLRSQNNLIPFILFTGRGREEVAIEALNCGADFYMQKGGSPLTQFAELEHYVKQGVQRYRAEKARRESDEHFRSLVDNSFEGIGVHVDGILLETNKAFCEITGYSREELIGRNITELFTPGTMSVMREKLKLPLAQPYDAELVRKDGRVLKVKTRGKNISWNGRMARLGTILDLSDHQSGAEDEAREKGALLASILESTPDINVFALDKEYRYMAYNKRHHDTMKQIWGVEIAMGMSMLDLVSVDEDRERARKHFDRALSGQSFAIVEEYGDVRFDRQVWHDYYSPVRSTDGQVLGVTCYCINATERERIKAQVEDANKKLRIISSVTRHDVINKLAALSAHLELEKRWATNPKMLDSIDKMMQITKTLEDHINFTKEYQDVGILRPEWQSVSNACREAQAQLDSGPFCVSVETDGLEVLADPMLSRVIYNLLDNSMKHGGEVSIVRITYMTTDDGVSIVYQDDGAGIDAQAKGTLFKEKLDQGHGLGLFLIAEILKITGITIEENGEPGLGARFEMRVPKGKFRSQ